MKILDVLQGGAEWHWARLGIPTASNFSRILTAKERKLAAGARTYMHELLSEWLTGIPASAGSSGFMERGTELEPKAVAYYEMMNDVTTKPVGFCLRDDGLVGCSPDTLVGDDGGAEIKCPSAKVHVANLFSMGDEHFAQVQGNMWITGREWWDLVSYHPTIPSVIQRIPRDDGYIGDLDKAVRQFLASLEAGREHLLALGAKPATELDPGFASSLSTFDHYDEAA